MGITMSNNSASKAYILERYPIPRDVKRGMKVVSHGQPGVITSFNGAYINVRFDGMNRSVKCHPLDLLYNGEPETAIQERINKMDGIDKVFNDALRLKR